MQALIYLTPYLCAQDTVVRYKRMKGFNALWVPGTDHAGIATQTVVEKKIARERQQTRHDIGRDAFVSEVRRALLFLLCCAFCACCVRSVPAESACQLEADCKFS